MRFMEPTRDYGPEDVNPNSTHELMKIKKDALVKMYIDQNERFEAAVRRNTQIEREADQAKLALSQVTDDLHDVRTMSMQNSGLINSLQIQLRDAQKRHDDTLVADKQRHSIYTRFAKLLDDATKGTSTELLVFTVRAIATGMRGNLPPEIYDVDGILLRYRVTLKDDGGRPIPCIKAIREMSDLGLRESKELVDPVRENPPRPSVLDNSVTLETAQKWIRTFREYCPEAVLDVTPVEV